MYCCLQMSVHFLTHANMIKKHLFVISNGWQSFQSFFKNCLKSERRDHTCSHIRWHFVVSSVFSVIILIDRLLYCEIIWWWYSTSIGYCSKSDQFFLHYNVIILCLFANNRSLHFGAFRMHRVNLSCSPIYWRSYHIKMYII